MELLDLNALIIQTINLAVVVWVLHRFLFKPYLAHLDEEAAKREKLEKDISASVHIVDDAQIEAKKILDHANTDAKHSATTILENARKDAEKIALEAQRDAELARQK
jgi:F-type H+-transporting ATPase subunit b